jgi:hypothetical protein
LFFRFAIECELENIVLECDCKMVTDALSLPLNVPWSIGTAIVEVRSILEGKPFWSIKWVKRNTNRAPHVLARWSLLSSIWGPFDFCLGPHVFSSVCIEDSSLDSFAPVEPFL